MKQPVWLMESESFFFLVLLTFCLGESFILGMFESTYASCARLVIQLLYKIVPWKTNKFLAPEMMRRLPSKDSCSITGKTCKHHFLHVKFCCSATILHLPAIMGTWIHQGPQLLTPGSGWCGGGSRGENRKWKLEILLSQGATEIFCWRYIDMQHAYTLYINIHFRHSYYSYCWYWCMYQQTTK